MKGPSKSRFEQIFSAGKRANGDFLRVAALPGRGLVGIATSKKIGNRPKRNLAKRRVAEAIRTMQPPLDKRFDYVVIVAVKSQEVSFERIQSEVMPLFARAVSRWDGESQFS